MKNRKINNLQAAQDHRCAVVLPDICFAARLRKVVYVEITLCVCVCWVRGFSLLESLLMRFTKSKGKIRWKK